MCCFFDAVLLVFFFVPATNVPAQPDDTMTIIGMYDTVPLIHEAKKSGATLLEFLRGVRQENAFAARSNVLLLGAELSDLGLGNGEPLVHVRFFFGRVQWYAVEQVGILESEDVAVCAPCVVVIRCFLYFVFSEPQRTVCRRPVP